MPCKFLGVMSVSQYQNSMGVFFVLLYNIYTVIYVQTLVG